MFIKFLMTAVFCLSAVLCSFAQDGLTSEQSVDEGRFRFGSGEKRTQCRR